MKITSASPSINKQDVSAVTEAIKFGWGKKMNFYIDKFSKNFSKFKKIKYILPVSHCTDAIHLSLLALNIKKGDEVIVPDLTWVASASPVVAVGAKPIFADVDKNTLCVSAKTIKRCITKKTKAVVVVDLFGNMPNWSEIINICNKNNLHIIEDASEAIGSFYKNRPSGSFGDVSVFSFNATKLIMSGQGGSFCTNNKNLYLKAKLYSHHGMRKESGKFYFPEVLGANYSWTNMQAAIAITQLKRIKKLIAYKKKVFKLYSKYLSKEKNIQMPYYDKKVISDYWIIPLVINPKLGIKKEILCKKMKKHGIDLRPMFYQLSSTPAFRNLYNSYKNIDNPNSKKISRYGICLPNGYNLSQKKIKYICDCLKKEIV